MPNPDERIRLMTKTRCLDRVFDAVSMEDMRPIHHQAGGEAWQAVIRPLQWVKRFGFGHINDVEV